MTKGLHKALHDFKQALKAEFKPKLQILVNALTRLINRILWI